MRWQVALELGTPPSPCQGCPGLRHDKGECAPKCLARLRYLAATAETKAEAQDYLATAARVMAGSDGPTSEWRPPLVRRSRISQEIRQCVSCHDHYAPRAWNQMTCGAHPCKLAYQAYKDRLARQYLQEIQDD